MDYGLLTTPRGEKMEDGRGRAGQRRRERSQREEEQRKKEKQRAAALSYFYPNFFLTLRTWG
jgi:hypothetical protein